MKANDENERILVVGDVWELLARIRCVGVIAVTVSDYRRPGT